MSDSLSETARGISTWSSRNHASSSSPFDQEAHLGALLIQLDKLIRKHFLCILRLGCYSYQPGQHPLTVSLAKRRQQCISSTSSNVYQYWQLNQAKSSFFGRDNLATSRFPEASSCFWICILLMFTGLATTRAHQNPMFCHTILRMKSSI